MSCSILNYEAGHYLEIKKEDVPVDIYPNLFAYDFLPVIDV